MDIEVVLNKNYLFKYFILLLFIPFIIFFPLEQIWANDPFQKVVLAPLAEEPLKLLIASLLIYLSYWIFKKSSNKKFIFNNLFLNSFVYFSIIAGFILGFSEGPIGNIFLHISTSSIGAILILFTYQKVKNKSWKNRYKIVTMFVTLIIPMFIHSVANQFLNITYANNHPNFNYLVIIGRFLSNNASSNQVLIRYAFLYSTLVFVIAILFVIIWHLYLFYQQKKLKQVSLSKERDPPPM